MQFFLFAWVTRPGHFGSSPNKDPHLTNPSSGSGNATQGNAIFNQSKGKWIIKECARFPWSFTSRVMTSTTFWDHWRNWYRCDQGLWNSSKMGWNFWCVRSASNQAGEIGARESQSGRSSTGDIDRSQNNPMCQSKNVHLTNEAAPESCNSR